jgi:hypothetical protein
MTGALFTIGYEGRTQGEYLTSPPSPQPSRINVVIGR